MHLALTKCLAAQYHEVMYMYLGKYGAGFTQAINILALGALGVVQIIACASDIHIMAPGLSKRDYALIFGAASMVTILIPTLHNYRLWSFIGLVATSYTSWFLVGAAVHHGKVRLSRKSVSSPPVACKSRAKGQIMLSCNRHPASGCPAKDDNPNVE